MADMLFLVPGAPGRREWDVNQSEKSHSTGKVNIEQLTCTEYINFPKVQYLSRVLEDE